MSLTASEVAGLQTTKYFNVAGMAILIFDDVITLEDEARWIRGRSWDATRFVFTISRYLPFVGMGMTAYAALRSDSEFCGPGLEENIIHILGIIAAEVLLILRTYAFWQGNKRLLFGLLPYGGVTICVAVATNVTPTQLIPGGQALLPGCPLVASRNSTFVYLFLLIFEMVVLFLTAYKHFRAYREVRTSIVHRIYRDGMFDIFCIMLIAFINVLIGGILPSQFSDLLDIVLASRIMFNLRKSSYCLQKGGTTDSFAPSEVAYHPPSSGSQSTGSEPSGSGSRPPVGVVSIYVDIDVELAKLESRWDSSISKV